MYKSPILLCKRNSFVWIVLKCLHQDGIMVGQEEGAEFIANIGLSQELGLELKLFADCFHWWDSIGLSQKW